MGKRSFRSLFAIFITLLASSSPVMAYASTYPTSKTSIVLNGSVFSTPYRLIYDNTTYMPIWYVMQILTKLNIENSWDGTQKMLGVGEKVSGTNIMATHNIVEISYGFGNTEWVPFVNATDPSSGKMTTFMPIWNIQKILDSLNITTQDTWNGNTRTWVIDTPVLGNNTSSSNQVPSSYPLTVGIGNEYSTISSSGVQSNGGTGVWQLQNGTFQELGNLNYPVFGLNWFDNSLIAGTSGHGVWEFKNNSWSLLGGNSSVSSQDITSMVPYGSNLIVASADNLLGAPNGSNLWAFNGKTWSLFSTPNNSNSQVASMDIWNGDLVVLLQSAVNGAWVWQYKNGKWAPLGGEQSSFKTPQNLFVDKTNLIISSANVNTAWSWNGSSWTTINVPSPSSYGQISTLTDYDNQLTFANQDGSVKLFNGHSWSTVSQATQYVNSTEYELVSSPTVLSVKNGTLIMGTGTNGVWEWNGVAWTNLSQNSPISNSDIATILQ